MGGSAHLRSGDRCIARGHVRIVPDFTSHTRVDAKNTNGYYDVHGVHPENG